MMKQSERSRRTRRSLTRDETHEKTRAKEERAGHAGVIVRGLVGAVSARAVSEGPAYTLSPEPMTERPILDAQGRPRSVWSAIVGASREAYRGLVRAVYPECTARGADAVLADTLLWLATQTRAWEPLPSGGWRVWIDLGRRASVEVYP